MPHSGYERSKTMKKSDIKKIIEAAEQLDWKVMGEDGDYELEKYSPAGQDFILSISADTIEEFADKLYERYDNWDSSEEAYIWLDEDGHGKNGAPYDMKDLYEDMDDCRDMIDELEKAIRKICN